MPVIILATIGASPDTTESLGTTEYKYDAGGKLRLTIDPIGNKSHVLYDEAGRVIATIDASGALTETVYDSTGNVVKEVHYATRLTTVQLALLADANGNPIDVNLVFVRPASDTANDRITRYAYDRADRRVMVIESTDDDASRGYLTESIYDGAGRVIIVISYANSIDVGNLPIVVSPSDVTRPPPNPNRQRRTRSFYDNDSKLIAMLDGAGFLTENHYDSAGRLSGTTRYANAVSATYEVQKNGTLTQLKGGIVGSTDDQKSYILYDAKNQLVGQLDAENYLTEFIYDAAGNKTQEIRYIEKAHIAYTGTQSWSDLLPTDRSAHVTVMEYNGANQVTKVTVTPAGTVTRYLYDEVGRLIQTDRAWNTSDVRTTRTRYDVQGQVINELTAEGSLKLELLGGTPLTTDVDAIWKNYSIAHTYDAAGRRTSTTDQNGNTTWFYYDVDARLTHTFTVCNSYLCGHLKTFIE